MHDTAITAGHVQAFNVCIEAGNAANHSKQYIQHFLRCNST
jgi:hypothetical protein